MDKLHDIEEVLSLSKSFAWETQKESTYWVYPHFMGTFYVSQYYLVLRYLDCFDPSKFNVQRLKEILVDTQRPDGGWEQVPEPNLEKSDLDATVFNYWFLKASQSFSVNDDVMKKARKFILEQGGLKKCLPLGKIYLCLFGQMSWSAISAVILMIFSSHNVFGSQVIKRFVADWVYSTLIPVAYLKYWKKQKLLGELFSLGELYCDVRDFEKVKPTTVKRPKNPPKDVVAMISRMKELRRPLGSFDAYSITTCLSLIVFQDWIQSYEDVASDCKNDFSQALSYVNNNYLSDEKAYKGIAQDGRWWDTTMILGGILEAGEDTDKLVPTIDYLLKNVVHECGGLPFGLEFEPVPDTDDTGLFVSVLAKYYGERYKKEVDRANKWLISMQNSDGGLPAFSKGRTENSLIRYFAGEFFNSAEIFDVSSVDVTAHVLEGWFESGYDLNDSHVKKAIKYIKKSQTSFGAWQGRWGCNYIYAVGAVFSAIASCKQIKIKNEKWLVRAIEWLVGCQNDDGGFGESNESYSDPKWIGRGKSTPSQTAWAMMALVEAAKAQMPVTEQLDRAARYLVESFSRETKQWHDGSSVGTGHRRIMFMNYPSYQLSWPLKALGLYKKWIQNNSQAVADYKVEH